MNNPRISPRSSFRRRGGFSLVEVTLAIGIVAFAFIALFGLVPTGLNVFRSAIDASVGSQILDQVIQNAQQTDYQRLVDNKTPADTYYDEQATLLVDDLGNPITDSKDPRSIYTVRLRVQAPTRIPSGNSANTGGSTDNVATLLVKIAKNPGHSPDPFTDANKGNVNNFTAYVSRNKSAFETK